MEFQVGDMVEFEVKLPKKPSFPGHRRREYKTVVTGRIMRMTAKGANVYWTFKRESEGYLMETGGYFWVGLGKLTRSKVQEPMACEDCHRSSKDLEGTFVNGNPTFPNRLWVVTPEEGEVLCEECWRSRFLVPQNEE